MTKISRVDPVPVAPPYSRTLPWRLRRCPSVPLVEAPDIDPHARRVTLRSCDHGHSLPDSGRGPTNAPTSAVRRVARSSAVTSRVRPQMHGSRPAPHSLAPAESRSAAARSNRASPRAAPSARYSRRHGGSPSSRHEPWRPAARASGCALRRCAVEHDHAPEPRCRRVGAFRRRDLDRSSHPLLISASAHRVFSSPHAPHDAGIRQPVCPGQQLSVSFTSTR